MFWNIKYIHVVYICKNICKWHIQNLKYHKTIKAQKNTQQINLSPWTPQKKIAPGSASCRSDRGRSFPSAVSGNNATWDKSWTDEVWKPHQNPPPTIYVYQWFLLEKSQFFRQNLLWIHEKFKKQLSLNSPGFKPVLVEVWWIQIGEWKLQVYFKGSYPFPWTHGSMESRGLSMQKKHFLHFHDCGKRRKLYNVDNSEMRRLHQQKQLNFGNMSLQFLQNAVSTFFRGFLRITSINSTLEVQDYWKKSLSTILEYKPLLEIMCLFPG